MESPTIPPEQIDSAQHTWVIDRLGRRFRRLPRGRDPRDPHLVAEWRPFFARPEHTYGGPTMAETWPNPVTDARATEPHAHADLLAGLNPVQREAAARPTARSS